MPMIKKIDYSASKKGGMDCVTIELNGYAVMCLEFLCFSLPPFICLLWLKINIKMREGRREIKCFNNNLSLSAGAGAAFSN